jgi:hypothetical protein
MKQIIAAILSLFIYINPGFTTPVEEIPDEFKITEHWISLTTSYDIETKTRKLGTLYRKFFSFLLTYEFFDPFDNKLAIATSRFFSFTAHFDIYDTREHLLGMAEERFFAFFPTFDVYDSDGSTRLVKASMNFWGTTFTIYDPLTDEEMAYMHRPFFRLKNDWTIKVTNQELFSRRHIDNRLLMTVLAFQGDKEYWEYYYNNSFKKSLKSAEQALDVTPIQVNALREQLNAVSVQKGLIKSTQLNQKALEAIAAELDSDYKNLHGKDELALDGQARFEGFTNYCLNLLQSDDVSDMKKQAIITLLKMRLDGYAA